MPSAGAGTETQGASSAMEIIVSRNDLLRELTASQGVVERKTTIPILSNFLFEAAGDKLACVSPHAFGRLSWRGEFRATIPDPAIRTSCGRTRRPCEPAPAGYSSAPA